MNVRVLTYNLGMGVKNRRNLLSRMESLRAFSSYISDQRAKLSNIDAWIVCLQEINRNDSVNQVEWLQGDLSVRTGVPWYKRSHTRSDSARKEAVAIYSTIPSTKQQRWRLGDDRVAIALKIPLPADQQIWVATCHLIKPEDDREGEKREHHVTRMMQHCSTFDGTVPIVLCGDMNVYDCTPGAFSDALLRDRFVSVPIFERTLGKLIRFGFTRGKGLVAGPEDATIRSWDDPSDTSKGRWGILDYIFVNEAGRCTALLPETFESVVGGKHVSDHLGVSLTLRF